MTLMRVIGDKNQITGDVFDFMISYLPFPQKSIRSELAKLFSISIIKFHKKAMPNRYGGINLANKSMKTNDVTGGNSAQQNMTDS